MKLSRFQIMLVMVILMTIGAAVLPLIDTAEKPRPLQGRRLTVSYSWPGASAKVVEQNVTSKIEGVVAAVKGVKFTESTSNFGSGNVVIELKPDVNVSAVKFEILSLLRQIYKQFPDGVSYPYLSGGEIPNEQPRRDETMLLLTYRINAGMTGDQLREYINQHVARELKREEGVRRVDITGATGKYIEISYNTAIISTYGISAYDIEQTIRSFMGREDIVGEVLAEMPYMKNADHKGRIAVYLSTEHFSVGLEKMPLGETDGKTIYLNDLATFTYKDRLPDSYFRVNGLNTVYLNLFVAADADKIAASRQLRAKVDEMTNNLKNGVYLYLEHDAAKEAESALTKLIWRTLLALFILLAFVYVVSRSWKYLLIIALTLLANILLAALGYWLFDLRLHIYSLAGITVSIGIIVDATVVMADHYSYYRNRKAFLAIFAALITTIVSLVVVLWLPDFLQKDLYDFALIIGINLTVSLIVAYFFAPTLIDVLGYERKHNAISHGIWMKVAWKHFYTRYINFTQKRKWIYFLLLFLAFGFPFQILPKEWNGSWKEPLQNVFGGTLRLFTESLSGNTYFHDEEDEMRLHIQGKMPLGGSLHELNEKVMMLEAFLSTFEGIKRFETHVNPWGASIDVEFTQNALNTGLPYSLENKVVGRMITIGGADWSTSGVSERGFSNSLNLQHRSQRIEVSGYNYDQLYRICEDISRELKRNSRIVDLTIETPGHEHQENEFYMHYDWQKVALYDFNIQAAHQTLKGMLEQHDIPRYRDRFISSDLKLKPTEQDVFDLWQLGHAQIDVSGEQLCMADFMNIERREAKNCIPKRNQEYVLRVAFNIMGSYTYAFKLMKRTIEEFNAKMPVGFRCQNTSWGYYEDTGSQYWLLLLIAVIIYFICAVLFESLYIPLAILTLIPVSFIGAFLTYHFTGVAFGTGGYAALVLLSGLTVNAGIYVVCEYQNQAKQGGNSIRTYVKAYNHKVTAIFLTLLSTILGLIPFLIDGKSEPFWFSFAVGASGGLLFSVIALVFYMPICMHFKK